jgi:signal transduction histidine kinase
MPPPLEFTMVRFAISLFVACAAIPAAGLALAPLARAEASASNHEKSRLVVMLYPENSDGNAGNALVDQGLRSTFAAGSPERIEIYNEYLDISRSPDAQLQQLQARLLRQKFADRKVDLVIAGLSTSLDFALKYRQQIFPGVPIIFLAAEQREIKTRELPPDVIGFPVKLEFAGTLELALRLHPDTQHVYVVAGAAKFDAYWTAQAKEAFRPYEGKREFVYLSALPMDVLLQKVAHLPARSIIYYLNIMQDGSGKVVVPADALTRLAQVANAPIYAYVDTYVGRGAVGGRVVSLEVAGENAARLGLRILAGEKPEAMGIQPTSENTDLVDWRQLRRWNIRESRLPPGSVVRFKEPTVWDLYWWQIVGVISLCVVETLLLVRLFSQMLRRKRTEKELRESEARLQTSQVELRVLAGRLLNSQEVERRRIARDLHDDINQSLALLSVELDLLAQKPEDSASRPGGRLRHLSNMVKQVSTSVHELSHRLHPAKLEQLGLVAALRGLCKEFSHSQGLAVEFIDGGVPVPVSDDVALCLYRIAQEALQNVIKHSGAQHARVELSGTADAICLRIADDGSGFDSRSLNGRGAGLGLVSIRERLNLVGGAVTIDSKSPGGTRIDVRIPRSAVRRPENALTPVAAT